VVVPGAGSLDFRGIRAFSDLDAYIMSAGPTNESSIYHTIDGGRSWKRKPQENTRPQGFFDAIVFGDERRGLVLGDPVDGSMFVSLTEHRARSWSRVRAPAAQPGEGAFAASGTWLIVRP
jgi:photosystem II stability/assembly factor-like uncharacterized protein